MQTTGEVASIVDKSEHQNVNEDAGPIYVSYREVKGAPTHSAKYNRKQAYVKHFYLIDVHGNETLAAFGEDQGQPSRAARIHHPALFTE